MWLKTALGGDDGPLARRLLPQQVAEHLQLSPDDFAGGVEGLVGGSLAGGIKTGTAPAHQFEQRSPTPGLFKSWNDHKQGSGLPLGECTGHQGPAGASCSAHQEAVIPAGALEQFAGESCSPQLGHQGTQGHWKYGSAIHDLRNRLDRTASYATWLATAANVVVVAQPFG